MYTFFVLGIIPGTNISISFVAWLQLCLLLAAAIIASKLYRTRKQRAEALASLFATTISH